MNPNSAFSTDSSPANPTDPPPKTSEPSFWLLVVATVVTGLFMGYVSGNILHDGTVVAALLTVVVSVLGTFFFLYSAKSQSPFPIPINHASLYLILLVISIFFGIQIGANSAQYRVNSFVSVQRDYLIRCAELEVQINDVRHHLLELPPLSHSAICPPTPPK